MSGLDVSARRAALTGANEWRVDPDPVRPTDDTVAQDEDDGYDESAYAEWDWADATGGGW